MSKVFKWIWREVALLRRYVGDVVKQWKGILGSAVVVSALWIAGHYGASLLARIVPFLPDTVEPWLTRNRLMVVSVFFILAIGQYLVWRKLRLATDRETRPRISRIEVEQEGSNNQYTSVYLVIENKGTTGDFTAELDVDLHNWPTGQRFACWDNHDARVRRIPEGSRGWIYLADLETSANHGQWTFFEWARSGLPNQYPAGQSFSLTKQSEHPKYTARLRLYSEPPMIDGPRTIKVRFHGNRVELVE